MTRLVSAIYSRGPSPRDPDETGRLWRLCRNLWRESGTIAVRPQELPEPLRGQLKAWAEDQYGVRHGQR